MSLLHRILRSKTTRSADAVTDRLALIVTTRRSNIDDFLPDLQKDLMAVFDKYVNIKADSLNFDVTSGENGVTYLEISAGLGEGE